MKIGLGVVVLTCGLLVACAKSRDSNDGDGNNTETKTESFSYDFDMNGCKTEKQQFTSREALCKALQDSKLNRGCALDLRKDEFKKSCTGQTFVDSTELPLSKVDEPVQNNPNQNQASTKEETLAKESFLKTLSSGDNKWNLKNIVVEYSKGEGKSSTEQWKENCTTTAKAGIKGSYPTITVSLGGFDCGTTHNSSELTKLQLITSNLVYSARHIPAYPSEPNQFLLDLQPNNSVYLIWKSTKSVNANLKNHSVYLDFLGKEKDPMSLGTNDSYFIEIVFKQSEDGNSETLNIVYSHTLTGSVGSVDIKIKADIMRVK